MSKFKIHLYMVREYPYNPDVYIYIRRENLETGDHEMLRTGSSTWPEAIVKTLVQAEVPAALYWITTAQIDRDEWDKAELVPEEGW